MSVVANVLCSQASWVAYDGRASRNGKIISESIEKALMVNDSVCVGYTGTLELAQLVILNLRQHVVGISNMQSDIVARAIELLLPKLKAPTDMSANFLITGTNSAGMMASYSVGSSQGICEYIPYNGELKTAVLHSDSNTLQLEPYIIKHINMAGFNNISVTVALREYIGDVSRIDKSVNAHCKILALHK